MSNAEAAITIVLSLVGAGIFWLLGYLKGRFDVERQIIRRHNEMHRRACELWNQHHDIRKVADLLYPQK